MTRFETWQRGARCYERSWWPVTSQFAPSLLDAVGAQGGTPEGPTLEAIDRVFAPITPAEPDRDHPLGDPERMRSELAAIGFESASFALEGVRRHWHPPTAEHVYRAELEGGGRKTELLARQPQSARDRIRAGIVEALRAFESAGGISIPMTAYVVSIRVDGKAD